MRHFRISVRSLVAIAGFTLTIFSTITLAQSDRSQEDERRDLLSKPAQVLAFMGVQPGWTVMDMLAGNGYYSEVLAAAVGPTGQVYLHNNQAYMQFAGKLAARVRDNRLPNVEIIVQEVDELLLPTNSLDMVFLVMAYHDTYFEQNGWLVKPGPLLNSIFRVLKPGGVLGIIDHHAPAGSGTQYVQVQHRIDAEFVKADVTKRGFQFLDSSDILQNDVDGLQNSVFDPMIRGNTSRFVFKFIKPE